MPAIISPATLESFAENRIKTLLEAQLTKIPDANILTGHTIDDEGNKKYKKGEKKEEEDERREGKERR